MNLDVVWQNRRKWARIVAVLLLLGAYTYLTRSCQTGGHSSNAAYASTVSTHDVSEGELTLLTYNVAGLPDMISAAETPRSTSMREISKKLNAFDIVNVQEDFHYHRDLYDGGNQHPYRTKHKEAIPYGDGLNTLSKYPIIKSARIAWTDCHGSDCLAAKGFSMVRLQLGNGITMDVYNVHATSQDNVAAAAARKHNFKQLAAYIRKHSNKEAVLVMGDFNAHYAASWDNVQVFAESVNLQDAWLTAIKQGKRPVVDSNFVAQNKLTLTDSCESIDKIFFRNSPYIEFTPRSYKIEKQQFSNSQGQALSDHCAVSFTLKWKKKSNFFAAQIDDY